MNRICTSLTLTLGVLLAGCGDKPSGTTPPAAPGEKEAAIKQAVTTAVAEAAPEVKKQAAEVFSNLGQQLTASTQGGGDALLKTISSDLQTRVQTLGSSLASNSTIQQQLNTGVQALLGNKDIDAVKAIGQVTAAKLTPEQTVLAKDVYNATAAFVTQRNFSSLQGMNSDVAQLSNSVLKGNYTEAMTPLKKIYGSASLTSDQKSLLGATFDQVMPAGWRDAAATLQKGADTLKKIGF